MKKITSYAQYISLKSTVGCINRYQAMLSNARNPDGIDFIRRMIVKHTEELTAKGFSLQEAEESLEYDREQYERIKATKHTFPPSKSASTWKAAIDAAWESGGAVNGAEALALAHQLDQQTETENEYGWV